MKCAQIVDGEIQIVHAPIPKPQSFERLIKVKAFAINRADILQIEGKYNSPDGNNIPGLEVAGIDVETGDEVCALLASGGYAEYVCAHESHIIAKPKSFNLVEAAALPEAIVTNYMNISKNAKAVAGETVLIHGGTSGIGSMAIQMAKLKGLKVIASVGDDNKKNLCINIGADLVINYHSDFDQLLKNEVDIIFDILGGEHFEKNISCLKIGGRICLIAVMAGSKANLNLASVLMKNLSIIGSTLRFKNAEQKRILIQEAIKEFSTHLDSKKLCPIIDSTFLFSNLPAALDRVRSRSHFGKVVVEF
ncbi:MAG: quinone oxidoreductase [Candidatus Midichloriaceae bacterium]|jgi:putative PIG3 family NAD(P)H quinone oxidoreductase|nr:quinone oxidoreductase [Candidatus Midichloriaceae bacterium]